MERHAGFFASKDQTGVWEYSIPDDWHAVLTKFHILWVAISGNPDDEGVINLIPLKCWFKPSFPQAPTTSAQPKIAVWLPRK